MAKSIYCHCGEIRAIGSKRCSFHQRESVAKSRQKKKELGVIPSELYGYRVRKANLPNYIYQSAKQSAKKRGLEFNIDKDDIVIPEYCPVFKTSFSGEERSGRNPKAPSIDRIDSTKGYIKGNIQILSWRANKLKSNGTLEEFEQLLEFLHA